MDNLKQNRDSLERIILLCSRATYLPIQSLLIQINVNRFDYFLTCQGRNCCPALAAAAAAHGQAGWSSLEGVAADFKHSWSFLVLECRFQ